MLDRYARDNYSDPEEARNTVTQQGYLIKQLGDQKRHVENLLAIERRAVDALRVEAEQYRQEAAEMQSLAIRLQAKIKPSIFERIKNAINSKR